MGDEQPIRPRPAPPRRARALRRGHRLHRRRRGGVRARSTRRRSTSSTGSRTSRRPSRRTPLADHLVGELIASEVEIKTGRCPSVRRGSGAMAERRAQLVGLVEPLGLTLGATGTHPWADWKDQRIIDTPHYRRNDELLRYVVWKNNTFGLHVHVGIRGADRAIAVTTGCATCCPSCSRSRRARRSSRASTRASTPRAPRSSRASSRAAASPTRSTTGTTYERVRPLPLRDGLDHRAHPAVVERPAAPRLPDGRDPDLRRPARPRRGAGARGARRVARRPDRACPRRG